MQINNYLAIRELLALQTTFKKREGKNNEDGVYLNFIGCLK